MNISYDNVVVYCVTSLFILHDGMKCGFRPLCYDEALSWNTCIVWFVRRKKRMEVGMLIEVYRSVFGYVVNFSTSKNLKETLPKFSKISILNLFRVRIFSA